MKRSIATLILAGSLLFPPLVYANAVPLPNHSGMGVGRLATPSTYSNWMLVWMFMAYTLVW